MNYNNPQFGVFPEEEDMRSINRKQPISKDQYSKSVKGNREAELEAMGVFSNII